MTLEGYIKWMKSRGIKLDDVILFVQDDGSGYVNEISDVPIAQRFEDNRHVKGLKWENHPKWVLGSGTT